MDESEVSRKRGRWGNFYSRKCGVKRSSDEGNIWFSAHTLYRHRCCLPTEGGALEDNRNVTAEILGKAYSTAGSSRQDSSSLAVGHSASPNRSSGVEDNGAGYDIGSVNHNSLIIDPDAFSNVETRNDASALEDKGSLKSNVIASFCNGNKHDMGLNDGGASEDNRNGTADILEKAYLTAGSSRQDSSSLVVGPSASPNRSGGFEDNGAGNDIVHVNDSSLVTDPDVFSNVETRNDASVLEDKASVKSEVIGSFCSENKPNMSLDGIANGVTPSNLKSEVIASFCNRNKHGICLNDGIANSVTPSSLNAAAMLENTAMGFDDQDRKIAGRTVACKLLEVPMTRMLHGEDVLWSTQDCVVSKYQNSYFREKEETDCSTVDDIWGQVSGSQVVIMPKRNHCTNEEQSIRKEDVDQEQPIQLKQNPEEIQDRSNDSITAKNAYERNRESSPLLKEGLGCLDKGVVQLKSSTNLDGFSPQNCQLDSHELVDHHNRAHRTGPILRSRRICLETSIATSVLKKHQRRLSTSSSFKGTISRKTNFMDDKFKKRVVKGLLEDYLKAWMDKNMQAGALECEHCLPFLVHAPRRVECYQCKALVSSGKEVLCTSLNCRRAFHLICAKKLQGHSLSKKREFKCPQHVCMVCGSRGGLWRCVRCPVAVHKACSPWPEAMTLLRDTPGPAVCWRHHEDWRLDHKREERTSNIKEAFHRLPIPYLIEDFKIERQFWKDVMGNENEPPPYVHVRRNFFLVKKKRDDTDDGVGCSCGRDAIVCAENCECRVQSMSCSKACRCSGLCTNKPFRKEKKIKIVKTKFCGWGAEAAEVIKKGEFVIEYIGEG